MKKDENLFGISKEEFRRQCSIKNLDGDLTQSPIVKGETGLEPCLRGAKKILEDPKMLKMVRSFLTNGDLVKDKVNESSNFPTAQKSITKYYKK